MRNLSFPIRWHLAAVALLAVVPLLGLGSYFIDRLARIERAQVEETARQVARQAADLLDREIQGVKAALITLQTSPALQGDDLAAFHAQAKVVVESFPGTLISLRSLDGAILASTVRSLSEQPIGMRAGDEILAADRRAIETRSAVVSDLYRGVITRQMFVSVVAPVMRDGVAKYTLNLTLTPERLLAVVSLVPLDSSWVIAVVDGKGRVVVRTRDPARFVGVDATADFIANTKDQRGMFDSRNLEGTAVISTYERSATTGWVVAAAVPRTAFEQPIRRSQQIIASLTLVSLLLSALLAASYGYLVSRPIRALQKNAVRLGAGDEVGVVKTGVTELDHVAAGLAQASTDLRKRDRQQFLLINELNHRVKNTLAVIQSLTRRTARHSGSVEELEKTLEGRLLALAASHDALTASNWQGADLHLLLDRTFHIFSQKDDRVRVSGPAVHLSNRGSVAFAMVLHELCTNAAKYGALSSRGGAVHVHWTDDGDVLRFNWTETGGPPVVPPERKGFGSDLIRACVAHDLDGSCTFHYDPAGFRFEAILPKQEAVHRPGIEEFHG